MDVEIHINKAEVVLVIHINSKIGEACNPNENTQDGMRKKHKLSSDGAQMQSYFKNNSMKTWKYYVNPTKPYVASQCILNKKSSIMDVIVVQHGNSKHTQVKICAVDVGTTDHCLIWAGSQVTIRIKNWGRR